MLAWMSSDITRGTGLAASAGRLAQLTSPILIPVLVGAPRDMRLHTLTYRPLLAYQSVGILAVLRRPTRATQRAMPMRLLHPIYQVGLSHTWLRLGDSLRFSRCIGLRTRPAKTVWRASGRSIGLGSE
jgi:hypothetical protein